MTFWQYLRQIHAHEIKGLTDGLAERFDALIGRGHSVADLLAHYEDDFGHLPADRLREMAHMRRSWLVWRRRKKQLERARADAHLPPLPAAAFKHASSPDELDALVRTARLCPREAVPSEDEWNKVLVAGAELWQACVAVARKHGRLRCQAVRADDPRASRYEPYLRKVERLETLAPHQWLAMRRGQREGLLALTVEQPQQQMLEQLAVYRPRLGPTVAERADESLLDELVRDDLEPWLLRILDRDAEGRAIEAACQSLLGLLRAAPLQARNVGALFIGRAGAPIAAVVADREGELRAQRVVKAEGSWLEKVVELFADHHVNHAVLPTSAPAAELLTAAETALDRAEQQLVRVRPAALGEARTPLCDPPLRLSPSVASALVLARRALDPIKEWASIDPVRIGVAEYQHDLDQERLRAALQETVELCKLQRRRGGKSSAPSRGSAAMARLNPLIKSMADLRAGMTVHGVVTNISHFGAFVNIGLPQEALVHISELSDDFVANPNEVVSIGQQVNATVLAVEPQRGRISLSMKTPRKGGRPRHREQDGRSERAYPERSGSPPARGALDDGSRRAPRTKAEALADLERLFKK